MTLGNHARGTGALEIYELAGGSLNRVKSVGSSCLISTMVIVVPDVVLHSGRQAISFQMCHLWRHCIRGSTSGDWGFCRQPYGLVSELSALVSGLMATVCRDLERLEMPVYAAKAHDQIINCIDGVGKSSLASTTVY